MDRRAWLRGLAVLSTAGMFLVLVMGAAVTNTGSAEGCGRSWPLCNGQFVPEFTVSTAIEYSHRAVTAIEGLLVLTLTISMLARWKREKEVVVLATVMVATLALQAGLGAGAVLVPQSPLVLATHFGVSLIAFASTFLSAAVVFERTSDTPRAYRSRPVDRRLVLGGAVYVLLVVYLGAYVRHAGLSLACADWPLCNGQVIPSLEGPTGPVFAHRVAALGVVILVAELVRQTRHVAGWLALGLVLLQALSGALVVWTHLGLFSTLAHAAIVALLIAALALLVRAAVGSGRRYESVSNLYSLSDATSRRLHPITRTSQQHALATTSSGSAPAGRRGPVADDSLGQRAGAERAERPDQ